MQYRHIRMTRLVVAIALVAIALVTAGSYWRRVSRQRALKRAISAILPSNVENATVGFHYTKTEFGKVVYSIKASRNLGLKDSKNILEDVEALVYGKSGDRFDRIHSARADYDQESGSVVFEKDVTILLSSKNQEAKAIWLAGGDPQKALLNKTLIKTSQVTYSQRTNRVDTPAPVQFTFNEINGSATGMHYVASQDHLVLDRDVRVRIERNEGDPPLEISSGSLDFVKDAREITFASSVVLKRGDDTLNAQQIVVRLGNDNRVHSAVARGNPSMKSFQSGSQLDLTADILTAQLGAKGKWFDSIVAQGNVRAEDRSGTSLAELTARQLTATFTGSKNELKELVGETDVLMKLRPLGGSTALKTTATAAGKTIFSLSHSQEVKVLHTSRVEISLRAGGREFERLVCPGPSTLDLIPPLPTQDRKIVKGDRFEATFANERNTLNQFQANGHVTVDVEPATPHPSRIRRKTQSDQLVARFDPDSGLLTSIDQSGNFQFFETELNRPGSKADQGGTRRASAQRAHYAAAERVTVLEGQPQVWDAAAKTTARTMRLDEQTDQWVASGQVLTMYQERKSMPAPLSNSSSPVFISADKVVGHSQSHSAVYSGNARMWQDDDVIKADEIQLEQTKRTLLARQHVMSTFLVEENGKNRKNFITVTAGTLNYEDARRQAQYEKDVVMKADLGVLKAPLLDIFLADSPKPREGRIDRIVAQRGVSITQPQRHARSERAEYFPRDEKVVLSGDNPTIMDEEKGASAGRKLTFFSRDDRILIDGDTQARATTQHKVARQ